MTIQKLMKGEPYKDHADKINYPVAVEYKHDEIRMHVIRSGKGVQILSYAGKPLHNLGQWEYPLFNFMFDNGIDELDCGVEVNGNYNDSYRWTRSSTGLPDGLSPSMVRFHLYDLPDLAEDAYRVRRRETQRLAKIALVTHGLPFAIPTFTYMYCEEAVVREFHMALHLGYEGLMLKDPESVYIRRKTRAWLKMKPEETADGKIISIQQAKALDGTFHNRAGSITVELEDGSLAQPGGMPHELAADIWLNPTKYIGEWCEFKYMMRDRQGGYRHPRFYRMREAKV